MPEHLAQLCPRLTDGGHGEVAGQATRRHGPSSKSGGRWSWVQANRPHRGGDWRPWEAE